MMRSTFDAAEQVDPRQLPDEGFVREVRQCVAREKPGDRHPDLASRPALCPPELDLAQEAKATLG
jgi:hypothetical protein